MLSQLLFLIFPAGMAYAAASDLLTMRIANGVSLFLVAAFLAVAPVAGLAFTEMGLHIAVGAAVLVVTFGMFAAGWIGGGDAKLAAAIALWMGPGESLPFLLRAALAGGFLTMTLLSLRRFPLPVLAMRAPFLVHLHDRTTGVPYGIALAAGALITYPETVFAALR